MFLQALDALREVLQERGVGGLFAGLTPSLVLSVYPALQHAIFDKFRKFVLCFVFGFSSLFWTQFEEMVFAKAQGNAGTSILVGFRVWIGCESDRIISRVSAHLHQSTRMLLLRVILCSMSVRKVRVQAQKVKKEHHLGAIEVT